MTVTGLLCFSFFTVYSNFVFLHTIDEVRHRSFRELSLEEHHEILSGSRGYPYQWRVLGSWIVRAVEVTTSADPHAVDFIVKTVALTISAGALMGFAASVVGRFGAVMAAAFYFTLTCAAFASQGYSIYYTNDYLMVAAWYSAVWLGLHRRYIGVALVTAIGALAKETMVLVPILMTLEMWRRGVAVKHWAEIGRAHV